MEEEIRGNTHSMEYYSVFKKSCHHSNMDNHEDIMLSGIRQLQKGHSVCSLLLLEPKEAGLKNEPGGLPKAGVGTKGQQEESYGK